MKNKKLVAFGLIIILILVIFIVIPKTKNIDKIEQVNEVITESVEKQNLQEEQNIVSNEIEETYTVEEQNNVSENIINQNITKENTEKSEPTIKEEVQGVEETKTPEENNEENPTEKALKLVKEEWGEDDTVYYTIDNQSDYIFNISVRSKETTASLEEYEVDTKNETVTLK